MRLLGLEHANWTRLMTKVLVVSSVLVLCATAYFVYSIDVLTGWKLILPKQEIHAGDTITVKSEYTKLSDVQGKASRYIECDAGGVFITYPINERIADKQAGKGGTGLVLKIPTFIPDLPTKCHIRVRVAYPVLPFRTVNETAISPEFILLPEVKTDDDESASVLTPQSTVSLVPLSSPVSSSSSQTTPPPTPIQRDTSQNPSSQQPEPKPEPQAAPITGIELIDGILHAVGL